MSNLRELQLLFQDSLFKQNDAVSEYISQPYNMNPEQRLQIYYNDYHFRLNSALRDDYKILFKMIPTNDAPPLIKGYFEKYPSTLYSLREIGYRFPAYLEEHSQPFEIIEMANFECEMLKALFSKNAGCLDMQMLATIAPDDWENLALKLHPSVRSMLCKYNTLDVWAEINEKVTFKSKLLETPSTMLIWRQEQEACFRELTEEEAQLFHCLGHNQTFTQLCETMSSHSNEEELGIQAVAAILQAWVQDGMFSVPA